MSEETPNLNMHWWQTKLSSDQNLGYLLYIGDYITQLYREYDNAIKGFEGCSNMFDRMLQS